VLQKSFTLNHKRRLAMAIDNFAVPEELIEHGWISVDRVPAQEATRLMCYPICECLTFKGQRSLGQHKRRQHIYAAKRGYLDKGSERGAFKINTVGENLVAMSLPTSNGADATSKKAKARKSK
jgi:hypothetical protein